MNEEPQKVIECSSVEHGNQDRLLLTIREVALILGCHKATVYRLVYQGRLRICRAFSSIRIPRKEIERLVSDVKIYDVPR